MANDGIPKGNPYWALVLGFSVAVAALFYGLWLISPRQLAQFRVKKISTNPSQPVMPYRAASPSVLPGPVGQ